MVHYIYNSSTYNFGFLVDASEEARLDSVSAASCLCRVDVIIADSILLRALVDDGLDGFTESCFVFFFTCLQKHNIKKSGVINAPVSKAHFHVSGIKFLWKEPNTVNTQKEKKNTHISPANAGTH